MREILKKKYVRLVIFTILGFSFVASLALAVLARRIPIAKTDVAITTELQENNSVAFYNLMRAVSFMADPLVAAGSVIVVAIFLIAIQYQREALFMLLVPVEDLVGTIIKNLVERPRPTELTVKIYDQVTGSSFPSGHVIHAVVFFGYLFALMFVIKKIPQFIRIIVAIFSLAMIMLMSVSRIYLGAHWASDVIGGYFVGFMLLSVLLFAYLRVTDSRNI